MPEPELIDFDGDFRVNMYRISQEKKVTEKVTEREKDIIERVGSDRKGFWKIL